MIGIGLIFILFYFVAMNDPSDSPMVALHDLQLKKIITIILALML